MSVSLGLSLSLQLNELGNTQALVEAEMLADKA